MPLSLLMFLDRGCQAANSDVALTVRACNAGAPQYADEALNSHYSGETLSGKGTVKYTALKKGAGKPQWDRMRFGVTHREEY
jgi:hypothetical protein